MADANKRAGYITMCEQTMGKVVTNPKGVRVQLAPDECVNTVGVGGEPYLGIKKGTKVGQNHRRRPGDRGGPHHRPRG